MSHCIRYALGEADIAETFRGAVVLLLHNSHRLHIPPLGELITNILLSSSLRNHNEQSHVLLMFVFRFVGTLVPATRLNN